MLDPRQKIRRHLYDRNPIQDGLDDVQGRAVEQQAVAAANGTPPAKSPPLMTIGTTEKVEVSIR